MELTAVPAMRQRVERLEDAIAQMPPAECPTRSLFAPGVYMREMTVPKGVTATGAVHKTEHMTVIVGHCLLTTEDGVREHKGHAVVVSKPGIKRAIFAIDETVVMTIHPTEETDLDKLCELLTESKADELLGAPRNKQLLAQQERESLCHGD
jgi:hypothetical protein